MRLRPPPGLLTVLLAISLLMAGCRSPQLSQQITIQIIADGQTRTLQIQSGSTVSQALQQAGLTMSQLDRVNPPLYTLLSEGDTIRIVRVQEEFETQIEVIPFERQIVRGEGLPENEKRLLQAGENGQKEITYRRILEDGVETSKTVIKTTLLKEARPEIILVGAQAAFAPIAIPGRIAYLAGGNAWLMDGSTANRRLLVNTGDLDGRIFFLSPDGEYLVFTRKSSKPADKEINTLWAVRTTTTTPRPFSLNAANIVHFAAWIPGTSSVAYSTVEPRSAAPGWQANNDLWRVSISGGAPRKILEASSGGVYGWWGTTYAFSPEGRLAYAHPDGVGLVDQDGGYLKPLLSITPLQTNSDWAWLPALAWGADGKTLFYLDHAPAPAPISAEASPNFDLMALSLENSTLVRLASQTGMFAYLSVSPLRQMGREKAYQIAFLQAIFPGQSETSRYRLMVMDRDGSNRRAIFPPPDLGGIEPQTPVWAPDPLPGQTGDFLAVVFHGNLWLVDSGNGQTYQVTGDGLISRMDWR